MKENQKDVGELFWLIFRRGSGGGGGEKGVRKKKRGKKYNQERLKINNHNNYKNKK